MTSLRLAATLGAVATTATVLTVTPAFAGAAKHPARTATTVTTTTAPATTAAAPAGQTTTTVGAWSFGTTAGWSPVGLATVAADSSTGHAAAGALSVGFAGAYTGAASPRFPVVPGDRYLVNGWASATTAGHQVGLALRFYDSSGLVLKVASQIGQASVDSAGSWTSLRQPVGLAPAGATVAEALFLTYDAPLGETHLLDDVTVTQVAGGAASIAGPLHTTGNHVLDASGRTVTFRGLAISGLERPLANAVPVSTDEAATAKSWGANFVRLPLAENPVLPGDCLYDATYLARVDTMVDAITSRGMVALVDLHTNAATACGPTVQQTLPDAGSVTFWQTVASRYKNNPLVAFDLYNEPHDVSDSVWRDGGTTTTNGVTYTTPGMQRLYSTVRGTGATNLVMASGTNWASDFPASAPLVQTTNLVYAVHAYTCPNGTPSMGAVCNPGPAGIYDPSGIFGHFSTIATTMPVMVTEFGWPDRNDGVYMTNVAAYVQQHGWAGWSAWAFDGTTFNAFDLVKDLGPANEPTVTGMAVIAGLTAN